MFNTNLPYPTLTQLVSPWLSANRANANQGDTPPVLHAHALDAHPVETNQNLALLKRSIFLLLLVLQLNNVMERPHHGLDVAWWKIGAELALQRLLHVLRGQMPEPDVL